MQTLSRTFAREVVKEGLEEALQEVLTSILAQAAQILEGHPRRLRPDAAAGQRPGWRGGRRRGSFTAPALHLGKRALGDNPVVKGVGDTLLEGVHDSFANSVGNATVNSLVYGRPVDPSDFVPGLGEVVAGGIRERSSATRPHHDKIGEALGLPNRVDSSPSPSAIRAYAVGDGHDRRPRPRPPRRRRRVVVPAARRVAVLRRARVVSVVRRVGGSAGAGAPVGSVVVRRHGGWRCRRLTGSGGSAGGASSGGAGSQNGHVGSPTSGSRRARWAARRPDRARQNPVPAARHQRPDRPLDATDGPDVRTADLSDGAEHGPSAPAVAGPYGGAGRV